MAKVKDYKTLSSGLDEVLAKLQSPDIQVDEAIDLYKRGLDLINELEGYLKKAENTIEQLRLVEAKTD